MSFARRDGLNAEMFRTTPPVGIAMDRLAGHTPVRDREISAAWALSRRLSAMGGLSHSLGAYQPAARRAAS
jgi:hypothetical protein